MENVTRRTAFGIVIGTGAGVTLLSKVPAYAGPSGLSALIETHRQADIAYSELNNRTWEAQQAFDEHYEDHPIRERLHVGGCHDPMLAGRATIHHNYRQERVMHCSERMKGYCPEAHRLMDERLSVLEAEDLATADRATARLEALEDEFGLRDLREQEEAAASAERHARTAFVAFVPATLADVQEKAAYALELIEGAPEGHLDASKLMGSLLARRAV